MTNYSLKLVKLINKIFNTTPAPLLTLVSVSLPLTDNGRQISNTSSHVWQFHLSSCGISLSNHIQHSTGVFYVTKHHITHSSVTDLATKCCKWNFAWQYNYYIPSKIRHANIWKPKRGITHNGGPKGRQ